jgi:hypothetical protein
MTSALTNLVTFTKFRSEVYRTLCVDSNISFCLPQYRRIAAHCVLVLQRILVQGGSQQVPQPVGYLLGTW